MIYWCRLLYKHLAVDLGAESGRVSVVTLRDEKISLEVLYRFPTRGVFVPAGNRLTLRWDVVRFFHEVLEGIRRAGSGVDSLGVDTWGVDYALLDRHGDLVSLPYHYRDRRTEGIMKKVIEKLGKEYVYGKTGIQFMPINTLYQLYAMVLEDSPQLRIADSLLMMPDLFNYWLTGEKMSEFTIATTTQFYDPTIGEWCYELLEKLDIPTRILRDVVEPGTILGKLDNKIAGLVGANMQVVATTSHDTASAVVAVPALEENFAYISSGTWSLVGIEVDKPVINDKALKYNFTNEGGYGRTIRFLKNVAGLWLIQELRKEWRINGRLADYPEIVEAASKVKPFQYFIDPDYEEFIYISEKPMSERIAEYCKRTGQSAPKSLPEMARTIFDSLAFKYRWVIEKIEEASGRKVDIIHIVGGGSKNWLLNQITADVTRRKVVAGPSEATTIGNAVVQMMALGEIGSIREARRIISQSFSLKTYEPSIEEAVVEEGYERWISVVKLG
ncbi:MAG: rhamnulokinase [Thermoprotei archaeon]|nr:MAG: rhamnulokinase [Thermoprotei archaeon]